MDIRSEVLKMASSADSQERYKLYKFTKILTLKVAQIVVQSRQGKKITHDYSTSKPPEELPSSPSNLQWFNLSIPDEPQVNMEAKRVLNGEVIEALSNVLCIEISLKTVEGDEMVLELWTVRMVPGCDIITSISTIYYRMSIMLKSTLSITRITPAYKMSRLQQKESYKIFHQIYGGHPNPELLGEKYKTIKVSELHTPIGIIVIEVMYRTKMTIIPQPDRGREAVSGTTEMFIKDNHFRMDSPRKVPCDKKEVDLSKPLTAGAFVDSVKIKELHDALTQQLPPEPPMNWLLAEKDSMDKRKKMLANADLLNMNNRPGCSGQPSTSAAASKAIEVPKSKDPNKYTLMDFPFADGSPITELANFYQECLQARSASEEWTEVLQTRSTDSDTLSQQLRMYEEAVPEFDSMVASMFSNSENSDFS
ncbi:autophagy-related protein 13 homolog [Epargyreus clarus]|uniref:autophagy-related protein 13 homolog n=1 Tax=Epargyreus clarus TaxID=520877 RepID=UPI003C2BD214